MLFQLYDLDALFLVTNVPDRSAYKPGEYQLTPFGSATSGVSLEHDRYGSQKGSILLIR